MSDALCGPSNALQNFQKHTAVDRTLQQDRLILRQSNPQGFRSQNPSEGIIDSEFVAFESNGLIGAPLPDAQHGGQFIAPAPHMPTSHPAEAPNWANDFQNLQISEPLQTFHRQTEPSAAPVPAASQQSWHSEFLRQQQQHVQVGQNQSFGQSFQPSFTPSYGFYGSQMGGHASAQETAAGKTSTREAFDESAFEAAFEQAKADMASQFEDTVAETSANGMLLSNNGLTEEVPIQQTVPGAIRIGSDAILQTEKNETQSANDSDELARTAGQLLNSVSNETNQKFRESNFLALMRRIRDREVHVEGDEFRETAQSLHPGGQYYPEGKRPQKEEGKRLWSPFNQTDHVHVAFNENKSIRFNATSDTIPSISDPQPNANPEPVDHDSLFASWNHGDRWA
ncbi:hypothetical protein BJX70DRAFT_404601 [Aspergillus crustosus]